MAIAIGNVMRGACFLILLALAAASFAAAATCYAAPLSQAQIVERAAAIDRFIDEALKREGTAPLPRTSDEQFVRRLYLDAIGRIPTRRETEAFVKSTAVEKRSALVDKLIRSPGYVSHQFNYWADILRVKETDEGGITRAYYIKWLKDALGRNMPYDAMVRQLLASSGSGWEHDNGAVGYYLRDRGMPLDNMANTMRAFLGTRMSCAQCHDHPNDRWTRHEFFQMAAFTHGLETENRDERFRQIVQREKTLGDIELQSYSQFIRNTYHRDVVHGNGIGKIKLPIDYQYGDAEPGNVVMARTIFGPELAIPPGSSTADSRKLFADWVTSPDNPRFTTVIVNRLWKRSLGRGLFEPVDEIVDGTTASHPELMAYLETLMKELRYDMQAYQRILFNTQAYQRSADPVEPEPGQGYNFRGRTLTRMTAEQTWDSLMTLTVDDVDRQQAGVHSDAITYSGLPVLVGKKDNYSRFEEVRRHSVDAHWKYVAAEVPVLKADMEMKRSKQAVSSFNGLARASELHAPEYPAHFLRIFGQSNREFIEAGSTAPTVPQFLSMFNGVVEASIIENPQSRLMKDLTDATSLDAKVEVAFVSILSRKPTADELALMRRTLEEADVPAIDDVVWSLLNTHEFIFVR
ncbi:DUF1549 domain-containing protein [Lacipirellula sp.]|uniref:DUF1549 domain-containing protein n=1 Tax=Lacipirellula sp. TaxID=2691419 RepID=UPI003D0E1033